MSIDTSIIPQLYSVGSNTWANRPLSGNSIGDLFYATDRQVLYRWDGSNWIALTIYSDSGLDASKPAAANLPDGSIYFGTDTEKTYQVKTGAWVEINAPVAKLEYHEIITAWQATGAVSTWTAWDLSGDIPAGALYAEIAIRLSGTSSYGVRKNGSALARLVSNAAAGKGVVTMTVALDAGRIIELYDTGGANTACAIGYWK